MSSNDHTHTHIDGLVPADRFISLATEIERQMKKYEKNESERRKEKEKENVVPPRRPSEEIAADGEGDGVRDK